MSSSIRAINPSTGAEVETSDLGFTVESRVIGAPVKRKTEITIPYRDSTLDLSEINGKQIYDDRQLTYKVWQTCKNATAVNTAIGDLVSAFMPVTKKWNLYDSTIPGYYFYAECIGIDSSASTGHVARATITFKASPYMYRLGYGEVLR